MSPYIFNGSYAVVFIVNDNGSFFNNNVYDTLGVRPVINLKADVTITGSGTTYDPYVVVGAE